MSRPAVLAKEARDDLLSELRWIGANNLPKAHALRDAVLVAARRLGEHPMLGRSQPELLQLPYRFLSLTRFQIVLVYNAGVTPPRILRLLGTARDFGPLLLDIGDRDDESGAG